MQIAYTVADCDLGRCWWPDRARICSVTFGDTEKELVEDCMVNFPQPKFPKTPPVGQRREIIYGCWTAKRRGWP
jgi:hypothetical protein